MPITSRIGAMSSRGFGQFNTKNLSASIQFTQSFATGALVPPIRIPSISIGTESGSRLVICAVAVRSASAKSLVLSDDGSPFTRVYNSAAAYTRAYFAKIVPNGTAMSLTLETVGAAQTLAICSIGAYSAYDLNSVTPYLTASSLAANSVAITISAQSKSVVLMLANDIGTGGASPTVSGVTLDYVSKTTNAGSQTVAGGSTQLLTAQSLTVSTRFIGSGSNIQIAIAAWR
jgi:hypothetical protein